MSTTTFSAILPASLPAIGIITARAAGLLLLYYATYAVYNLYLAPLAKFPGPRLSAISRLPFLRAHFRGKLHDYFVDLHAQYGPIVRVAPDELTTISPSAWKEIYQRRPALPKDPLALTPPPNGAESLFTAEGHVHSRIRRTFADAFSEKAVREQSCCMESFADLLISRLSRDVIEAGHGDLDIAKYYGYTTLDIMGELCLGESFQSLEGSNEHNWIKAFFIGGVFGSLRSSLSRYYPLDQIIAWFFMQMTSNTRQRNFRFGVDMITRRLDKGDLGYGRSDIISPVIGNIIEAKDEATKSKGVTRDELNVNLLSMMLAGSQLATTALAASTYYLLRHPETMKKLKQEIYVSFASESDITVASTLGKPYMEAVISETLRMHHPTPSDPKSRVVAAGGQEIAGHWVPGGVRHNFDTSTGCFQFAQQLGRARNLSTRALAAGNPSLIRFTL
ncbi:MAG: hypothetical protein ASARMPRED_007693 [Alectoria sarmentosa]|nr:MAG: hypothetical protein ASARMPRED_007693 [Alectoria sarmentosa]